MLDVVVVGAGVSGLTLAWRLMQAGKSVQVVEARGHVGGRTYGFDHGGFHYDLGATWIWESEASVRALLDEVGIPLHPSYTAGDDLYDDGSKLQRGRIPQATVAEYRVAGGTATLALALAKRVGAKRVGAILFNQPAQVIEPMANGVRVRCEAQNSEAQNSETQHFEARHVAFAAPPSLLGGNVVVHGVAPKTLHLLSRVPVWMGDIAKVIAVFERPFWRDAGLSGRAFSRDGPMTEIYDMTCPLDPTGGALFGFVHKIHAQAGWEDAVAAQWVDFFGEEAATPSAVHIQTWWQEPRTVAPGAGTPIQELFGHPMLRDPLLSGRLHLISTETAAVSTGHIEGAVHRGEQAAKQILASLV